MSPTGDVTPAVVVGSLEDEHAQRVASLLSPQACTLVDVVSLAQRSYRLDRDGLWLDPQADHDGEDRRWAARVGRGSRGWLRRFAPPDWHRGVVLDSKDAAVKTAWLTLLTAFVRTGGVEWLTDLDALNQAENKLVQYRAALTLGIATPATAVASDRASLPADLAHRIVVKPLGPGHFTSGSGEGRVLYANMATLDETLLDDLPGAPFIVQDRIEARTHLRVVTVRGSVWACAVDASDVPFDWRRRAAAQRSFSPARPPVEVTDGARRISEHLRLGYTSQDWVIDHAGTAWFLDLNPSGQWLFLPEPVASAVAERLAAWLTERS
jgi:glutathione synthase/RimK-type ligase-like ATP-grasp enzyme